MGLNGNDQTQSVTSDQGIRTQYGIILPPGARVAAYVRSTGIQSGDDAFLAQNLVTTLAAGLARARPGMGDFVVCLPGHTENVADATTFSTALVAGTRIIGVGRGSNTPTFSWALSSAVWAVNKADVFIGGLRLNFNAIGTTTIGINVTASDFGFSFNDVIVSGATGAVQTLFVFGAGADRFDISGNTIRGINTLSSTTVSIASANADSRIADNEIQNGASVGLINVSTASTNLRILRNTLNNSLAASVAAITYANVASSGQAAFNTITVLSGGAVTPGTTGITVGGTNNLTGFFNNYVVNSPNASGLLLPAVDT